MGGIAPPAFVLLLSPLAVPAVMAQSWAEPSPAISDPEGYAVDAAVLPRPVLDENHRGPIAIQIETAPGPEGCPQAALITDEWRAAVAAVSRATIVAGSENTSVVKSDRLESTETSLWASRWRESLPARLAPCTPARQGKDDQNIFWPEPKKTSPTQSVPSLAPKIRRFLRHPIGSPVALPPAAAIESMVPGGTLCSGLLTAFSVSRRCHASS